MRSLLKRAAITLGILALVLPIFAAAYTPRTIVNPASNSTLSSSVMRNELQILENEIAQTQRDWTVTNAFLTPTTTIGVIVSASSTIGNGAQNGGLLISGGATTTGNLVVQGPATSTFANGISATYLNLTGSSATSTASNGFNIVSGCYAIGGLCVSGSGGSSFNFTQSTNFGVNVSATTTAISDSAGFFSSSTIETTSIDVDQYGAYKQAGFNILIASSTTKSVYLGFGAGGPGATSTGNVQGNTVLGYNSGAGKIAGSDFNTLLGYQAGFNLTTGANNILIGAESTAANANLTTGSNNIYIGYNMSLPSVSANNQLNIGNLIFGTSLDGSAKVYSTGAIGIGSTSPFARLSIHLNNGDTNRFAFAIGSSTSAGATTTLFAIDNSGNVAVTGSTTVAGQLNAVGGATFGSITVASCSGCSSASFPFAATTNFGVAANSTTTQIFFKTPTLGAVSLSASSTAQFDQINVGTTTASANVATSTFSGSVNFKGNASTSQLVISNVNSALLLNGTSGAVGAYGGASACSANNFVTALSAIGGTTCGTASVNFTYSGNVSGPASIALGGTGQITVPFSFTPSVYGTQAVNATSTGFWVNSSAFPYGLIASTTFATFASTTQISSTGTTTLATSGGFVGIGSTTPYSLLSINPNGIAYPAFTIGSSTGTLFSVNQAGGVQLSAREAATSTSLVYDWNSAKPLEEYQMGSAAYTLTFINATTSQWWGSTRRVGLCNSASAAGAITINGVLGISNFTQTTTANKCDYLAVGVVAATSTVTGGVPASYKLMFLGSQSTP